MESQKELRPYTVEERYYYGRFLYELLRCCLLSNGGLISTTIACIIRTGMPSITSEKQVSEGLLRGDHSSSFSLSKREFRLHKNERVSPNARNRDF